MPFVYSAKVEFADTDSAGVAHFTSILKIVERAEHAYLTSLGVPVIRHSQGRGGAPEFGWPRVDVRFSFRRPLFFGDDATVRLVVDSVGVSSIVYFAQVIGADGEIAAEGRLVNACVGQGETGRMAALPIPGEVREILVAAVEGANG